MANILGQRRTTYLDEDPSSAQGDIFRGLNNQISGMGAEITKKKDRQAAIDDAIALIKAKIPLQREATQQAQRDKITGAIRLLKAKQRYAPEVPTTSISITEQPYSERLKAREITARNPEDWYRDKMATGQGSPVLGGGFLGMFKKPQMLTDKKGKPTTLPQYEKYDLSLEAIAMQNEARQVLGRKNRVTKRITSKGGYGQNAIDTTAEDTGNKTAEERFNELVAQGMTEDEVYQQLKDEGYSE